MTPADLPAAIRAMEARKIPDMQAGIDFNDDIGVPKMDALETKDVTGTISTPRHSRVRFRAGSECGEGLFEDGIEFDGYTLTIEVSVETDALAMIDAIKADRISNLEAQLAEAQAREAVAYEVAAKVCTDTCKNYAVLKPDGKTYWPMKVQEACKGMARLAREDIRALTPTDTTASLERMLAEARNAALDDILKEIEGHLPEFGAGEPQDGTDRIIDQTWRSFRKVATALKTEPTP